MANICYNDFHIGLSSDEDRPKIVEKLNKLFEEDLYGEITYEDEMIIEGWFESRWTFPMYLFENLFDEDNLYFRCLSTEYGCEYVAMNIYDGDLWRDEQTFDL